MNLDRSLIVFISLLEVMIPASAQTNGRWAGTSSADIQTAAAEMESLYLDLHRNPELSLQERRTSTLLGNRMRAVGYDVTTGVGGMGLSRLRNGAGPTVLLRTDMDALPVEEKTGVPYASTVTAKNASGATVPVMHACGHDLHMAAWLGTAMLMVENREHWRGTLILIGQPAKEIGVGASAMLKDGLLTRFAKQISLSEFMMTCSRSVDRVHPGSPTQLRMRSKSPSTGEAATASSRRTL